MDPPEPAPPPRSALRWLVLVGALSVVGALVAGLAYKRHADVWLRTAKAPRCALGARRYLKEPTLSSGTEPHDTPDGQTVYLTENEDRAVRCAKGVSPELGARFVAAFTEIEPERRSLELLKILRDVPRDPARDRDAAVAYYIASSALQPIPDLPEKKAAADEIELIHTCRFDVRGRPCPTRPSIPWVVWVLGVPSALGLVGLLGLGLARLALRVIGRLRQRRAARAAPIPAPVAADPAPPEAAGKPKGGKRRKKSGAASPRADRSAD